MGTRWLFHTASSLLLIVACQTYSGGQQSSLPPSFKKQGDLYFLRKKTNDTIRHLDIEFATTDAERETGLMFRRSMEDSQGMLFIFAEEEEQSFWMKNTYISLDIIYINKNREIVSIQKRTRPLSEQSLPSDAGAQYVLEVNGGYSDKYGIRKGDKISFAALIK